MKDLNTVKKSNPIGKLVYFDSKEEAQRFVDLYKDLFFIPKNGSRSKDGYLLNRNWTSYFKERSYYVYFSIFKSDWEKIETDLKLERISKSPRGYYFKN